MPFNFRFWLLESSIRINEWSLVEDVIANVYDHGLDLTLNFGLLNSITEAFHWFLEPLYRGLSRGKLITKV